MERKTTMLTRTSAPAFKTREDGEQFKIEGYFAVFNSNYEIFPNATESIAQGAFKNALKDDVRALINHDSTLVLGRTKAGTLTLKEDAKGLWGCISINPSDTDAMNIYSRVKRGDVTQCSFGFDILEEDTELKNDGSTHWTIKAVKLYEVSICTFPAYEATNVEARKKDLEAIKKRRKRGNETAEQWRKRMLKKLKAISKSH